MQQYLGKKKNSDICPVIVAYKTMRVPPNVPQSVSQNLFDIA
ncbi:hypothetical protein [Helicobacter sp. T3_23-1059]